MKISLKLTKESIVSFPFHRPFSPSVNGGSSLDTEGIEKNRSKKGLISIERDGL